MKKKTSKIKSIWGVGLFYFLIAFEFFYMASPFGIYLYGVYKPALHFLNNRPALAWLIQYFLPHAVVETANPIINAHNIVGGVMAIVGFLGFLIGACQIYYYKLAKKGVVTGGIYNYIRHPQYAFFILCSIGLLLLWPRYIVLFMCITMIFIYYFLARAEEKECEKKFGDAYANYKNKTYMFFPFKTPKLELPKSGPMKVISVIGIYILSQIIALLFARMLHNVSINSLYAFYSDDSATISICELNQDEIKTILEIAKKDETVQSILSGYIPDDKTKYVNYIMPVEWYVAEVPMNKYYEGQRGHSTTDDYNPNTYKIIYTFAELQTPLNTVSKEIIKEIKTRIPIIEVWVDIENEDVIKILEIEDYMYKNTPVSVY